MDTIANLKHNIPKYVKGVNDKIEGASYSLGAGTMDMIYKIKNTVSGALPGNPVTREFEIIRHVASAGPGNLWKVYDAIKKTTKQEASVFMFEKKQIERYSKRDKEIIISALKNGVAQLTRLRHPKILSVLNPIEESRDSLAFATERVFASLANMLGKLDNMPNPIPSELKDCKLYDVEIKYGLLQVTEGLRFLHNDVKLLHKNISPESIVVVKNGAWKLSGFDFSLPNIGSSDQPAYSFIDWDPELPHVAQPSLNFLAPEYKLTESCNRASDMFSYGVLMYSVFNQGKPLYECNNQISTYDKNVQEMRRLKASLLGSIPQDVRDHVKMLLNAEPSVRPDADQVSKLPFFEDVGVMALLYLDTLIQRDNLEKSQFFKGLPQVVVKLPKRVHIQRILPCLFNEFVNIDMIPFVLPSILTIADILTDSEFISHVLPQLKTAFSIESPVQISLIFMQNMNLLLQKTPATDIKNHILPMIYRALESNSPQIQEICLSVIPTFASLIEYGSMKNAILPRIRKLCLSTSLLGVRVNCLVSIGKLLEYMDKWFVLDEVLPLLEEIPSREPAVLMSILGIYQVAFSHKKLGITKEILATKTLPILLPLCIDNNLNLKQFNAYISVIKEMVGKIETDHRSKLEQLDSMQQEQRTINISPEYSGNNLIPVEAPKSDTMMDRFLSGFGIGLTTSSGKNDSKVENISEKKSSNSPTHSLPKAENLTLEEKQRLAQEQETQQQLKNGSTISPKPQTTSPNKPKVKDITSSLVNSNFMNTSSGLNTPSGFNTRNQTRPPSYNISNNQGINYNMTSTNGNIPPSSAMYGPPRPVSYSGGMGTQPQQPYGSQTGYIGMGGQQPFAVMGNQTARHNYQPMPPKQNVDLSAFDSLLQTSSNQPRPTNQPRPSLNQLSHPQMIQQTPFVNPQPIGGQQRMMGQQSMMGNNNTGFFGNLSITSGQNNASHNNQFSNIDDVFGGQTSVSSHVKKKDDIADIFG